MTQLTLTRAGNSNGGAAFVPTDLSGNIIWLRSDKGVTLNGSTVSSWTDQSPTATVFSQGTAALQPTYNATSGKNSLDGITFDGGDHLTGSGTFLNGLTAYTIFSVCKHTADGVFYNATGDAIGDQTYLGSRLARFGGTLGVGFGGYVEALSSYYLVRTVYDGSQTGNANRLKMYQNGAQKTPLDFSIYAVSPALPSGVTNCVIGRYELGGFNFTGVGQEMIMYNRVLTAGEITQVENYLVGRYGSF